MADSDNRPAIIKFVERVNRAVGKPMDSAPFETEWHTTAPVEHDHLPAVNSQDRARIESAARYALSTHPGPVGELIHRELQAFLEFGYRFDDGTGLAHQLVEHVITAAEPNAPPSR